MQTDNTRLRITEYALYPGSGAKAGKTIRVPQTSMFSHPEIMPDFSTVETVKSPSYSNYFPLNFYPLDREKSQNSECPLFLVPGDNRDALQMCGMICRVIREKTRFVISIGRAGGLQRVLDGCGIPKAEFDEIEKGLFKV